MLAPVFFTKLNIDVLFPSCCLVEEAGGAGLVVLETGLLGVGEVNASDVLKLRVLERTDSNCFTDFTRSLSLPKVETTLILLGVPKRVLG